jgi:histidinol-phosphatase
LADLSTELAAALEFARLGGRIAMGHFRKNPQSRLKDDGTWVTEADWAVEAQIRLRIARTFPDHNVLGEEEGLSAAGGGPPVEGAPTWIIDPIDGTIAYMRGIPIWATLIALRHGENSVVGVASAPALDEVYDAAVGLGARCNGESIQVDPIPDLSSATVLFGAMRAWRKVGLADFFKRVTDAGSVSRGYGDFWAHMLVARGAAHVAIEPELSIWDVAALEPIVAEAGGRITGLDAKPWADKGPLITTNGALHDTVLALA